MPLINPGIVVGSPFLATKFTRTRRQQTVNAKGRATLTYTHTPCCAGIINSATTKEIETVPEDQRAENMITVLSRVELWVTKPGYQADMVTWAGTSFKVLKVNPYPHYGLGWYVALCGSLNATDLPPENDDGE